MIGNRRLEKAAWSVRQGHPTELPAPRGLRVRFCWSGFLPTGLENDLFRLETQVHHSPSGIQSHAEAVVVRAVRRVVRVAVRRPAIRRVVVPTAATVHAVRALKDRSPPMVVTQNSGIANSLHRLPAKKPSTTPDAAASSTRLGVPAAPLVRGPEHDDANGACFCDVSVHGAAGDFWRPGRARRARLGLAPGLDLY